MNNPPQIGEQRTIINQFYNNGELPFSYNNQRKTSDADKKKRRGEDENQLVISMDNVII